MQYNQYKHLNIGMGIRVGPVWFGMNDFFSLLTSKQNRYGTSGTMILKLPILYKAPHDMDGDHVSDDNDLCPDIPGLVELNGCPDTDRDGVADLDQRSAIFIHASTEMNCRGGYHPPVINVYLVYLELSDFK